MAVLLQASEILEAMRAESARLSEGDRDGAERNSRARVKSLHARDESTIAMTGSSDESSRDRANEEWQLLSGEWERELESIQSHLFRSRSPELAALQVWALTRVAGVEGTRAGLEVLLAMFEDFAKDEPPERWELLGRIDAGEPDDVLRRTLGRARFLGGPMEFGARTALDRVDRHFRGESDAAVANAIEQELAAESDERIRDLEACYRGAADLIERRVRPGAIAAGVADASKMLEASRRLLHSAAGIVRSMAPDQFRSDDGSDARVPAAAAARGGSPPADTGAWEEGYLAARDRRFRELEAIGSWFRRFEPHNPIGHAIPSLVKRAGLDLPRLIAELAGEDHATRLGLELGRNDSQSGSSED